MNPNTTTCDIQRPGVSINPQSNNSYSSFQTSKNGGGIIYKRLVYNYSLTAQSTTFVNVIPQNAFITSVQTKITQADAYITGFNMGDEVNLERYVSGGPTVLGNATGMFSSGGQAPFLTSNARDLVFNLNAAPLIALGVEVVVVYVVEQLLA